MLFYDIFYGKIIKKRLDSQLFYFQVCYSYEMIQSILFIHVCVLIFSDGSVQLIWINTLECVQYLPAANAANGLRLNNTWTII